MKEVKKGKRTRRNKQNKRDTEWNTTEIRKTKN